MFRKPAFWILFALISAGGVFFAWKNFSATFPVVSLDIRMDRNAALDSARAIAGKYAWPPAAFDQAASFRVNQEVQNFIELEGGGKDALRQIIATGTFEPYTWLVRNFKEGDPHESLVRFTPTGEPYGFVVRIPEKEPGASLDAAAARAIAERAAVDEWHVDLSKYPLAESSEEVRPGGRKDHTFVYERQDVRAGEGRYRLRLVVGGDRLTELTYFLQIPEAFSRRYSELRSANDAISALASMGALVYLLGFCGIGLFFMMRQGWLLWKPALLCGVVIAALAALGEANSWPLVWMDYDTALPSGGFVFRQVAAIAGMFLANAFVFSLSFMAAETLSRRAFTHHVQFWNVWRRPASASREVLGGTLAGYFTVSLAIAYIIFFYSMTQSRFGWWSPSDTLVNPDVFAAYVPSFSAAALAAQAGFWEECLFRAVPLSIFALIGDRLGKRRLLLILGMVVQALVFGSGHAGYANQPSYARVVELIVPSTVFGAYFLAFGLLPGIVMHYAFDAVLMSLPIYAASTARAHLEQVFMGLLILVPLFVVLAARARQGKWIDLPEDQRNLGWKPALVPPLAPREVVIESRGSMSPAVARLMPVAGLIGLIVWLAASHFRSDILGVESARATVEAAARQALAEQGFQLQPSWKVLSRIESSPSDDDRFVWQKAGRAGYLTILGTYLAPPHWLVRFARFEGDVAERAEEYQVSVSGDGRVFRVRHELPEAKPGTTLSAADARLLAQSAVQGRFIMSLNDVEEISADAKKRPARGDWRFEFKDKRDYGMDGGEPRIGIEIAGDQVADANRFVHVPEEWERNERNARNVPDIVVTTIAVLTVSILLTGAIAAVIQWSRKQPFSTAMFMKVGALAFVLNITNIPNNWRSSISQLFTSQPYGIQVGVLLLAGIVTSLVIAVALGLVSGLVLRETRSGVFMGVCVGCVVAGARALGSAIVPLAGPTWPDLASAGAAIPFVASGVASLTGFINQTLVLSLVFLAVGKVSSGWTRKKGASVVIMTIGGLMMAGRVIETIPTWLAAGVLIGLTLTAMYVLVLRFLPGAIIPFVATMSVLSVVREGAKMAYPQAVAGAVLGIVFIVAACFMIENRSKANPPM